MHYDILIYNGTVITMDRHNRLLPDGYVGISGSDITAVDVRTGDLPPATQMIDARGGLIMPGLVNAHTHAAMTLFRGLADDLPLMDWLNHYIFRWNSLWMVILCPRERGWPALKWFCPAPPLSVTCIFLNTL